MRANGVMAVARWGWDGGEGDEQDVVHALDAGGWTGPGWYGTVRVYGTVRYGTGTVRAFGQYGPYW